jgi:hypothetical protein
MQPFKPLPSPAPDAFASPAQSMQYGMPGGNGTVMPEIGEFIKKLFGGSMGGGGNIG